MRLVPAISLLFFVNLFSNLVHAQAPSLQLQPITATRPTNPTFAANANDGTGRMFILEQPGRILVVPRGSTAAGVFLDITDRVQTSTERGLLGLAFHPNFAENRRFFIYYTRKPDGTVVLAEYHASASNPNASDRQEIVVLTIPHPDPEHNGGMLAFGHDGYLYISVGDGGPGNDPSNRAQDLNSLLGKMLRIDIDQPAGSSVPYSSPVTNPFYGQLAGRDEIYAYGFRNPWRFSFDPATGEIYLGDVGQDAVEEIDVVEAGGNYGWRVFEGFYCTRLGPAPCIPENYISAIHTYVHTGRGGRCSVTGGYVYRGNRQTFPFGAYIFGDYCTGEILMFYRGEEKLLLDTTKQITSFGVDEDGEIYVVGGTVDRIVNTGPPSTPTTTFALSNGGGVSFDTTGDRDRIMVDHAQIQLNDEDSKPAGLAFIEFRNNGVLISESAVPATSLMEAGRFYGEVGAGINTGVAIANPDMARPATIAFSFTDAEGNDFGSGFTILRPGGQLAAFLDEAPFLGPPLFSGSVTFTSSVPVAVIALRGIMNERSEFLTTTLPVVEVDSVQKESVLVPQLAAGGGWMTDILLLNPTDGLITGAVEFISSSGQSETVVIDGVSRTSLSYAIPQRTSRRFRVTGGNSTTVGSFAVKPNPEQVAPAVATVYAYVSGGITISATGSEAIHSAREFSIYVEAAGALGTIGSIQTGIAIANPASEPVDVSFGIFRLDGSATGVSGTLSIPANGQRVSFVRELPGAADLAVPFRGLLRVFAESPVAALAIRGRYNERGDFLLSTTTPGDPNSSTGDQTFIPHIVDGAGYSTQIVIYDLGRDAPLTGNIYFFDQSGQPVNPGLR